MNADITEGASTPADPSDDPQASDAAIERALRAGLADFELDEEDLALLDADPDQLGAAATSRLGLRPARPLKTRASDDET
jgi:hypothetical protein